MYTSTEESPPASPNNSFPPLHIIQPQTSHTHTAVLLHGLGSDGQEFAEELFESALSNGNSLRDEFPSWRWVFPSSKTLWSTTFQEHMPAWFEAHSLTDTTARQDLQVSGIRDSVTYICEIIDDETQVLDGKSERLVLGGMSQGGAVAMWTLLCYPHTTSQRLCAFIGTSSWLPFAAEIKSLFAQNESTQAISGEFHDFVKEMVTPLHRGARQSERTQSCLQTPVFMGHGSDDAYVDIELGREASGVLSSIGFGMEWREYSGAEQEGHWLKVPDEVDNIRTFIVTAVAQQ